MASTINEAEVYRMMDEIAGLKAKLAQQEQITNDISKAYDEKLSQAYVSGGIKESTQRIIKEWQLFAGERATENSLIAEQLEFTVRVAQDWQARAEAAERRVTELEARLAEYEWRPVTEKPTEPGTYLVYDADGEPYLFAGVWPYRVARWDNGWGSGLDGLVDYWRPLPAPPIDPPAPA